MDLEKLKRIKNLIIAKILFVFGWIYDLAMRILNAVNKTPIEKNKKKKKKRPPKCQNKTICNSYIDTVCDL